MDGEYRRTLRLPHGPATVRAARRSRATCWPALRLTDVRDLGPAVARLRRLLDLDADPVAVDELLAADPALAGCVAPDARDPAAGHRRRLRDGAARGARAAGVGGRGPHRGRPAGGRARRPAAARAARSPGAARAARPALPHRRGDRRAGRRGAHRPARRIATVLGLAAALADGPWCSTPAATRPSCAPSWSRCPASARGPPATWPCACSATRTSCWPPTSRSAAAPPRSACPPMWTGCARRRALAALALLRRDPPLARERHRHPDTQEDTMTSWSTVDTPLGPFTAVVDDDGAVLACGWTAALDELLPLIHPTLRPRRTRRADLGTGHRGDHPLPRRRSDRDRRHAGAAAVGPFLVHAWDVLRTVPAGAPVTYTEFAASPAGRRRCARRRGLRPQRGRAVRAVPPGAAHRRHARRVPLGPGVQALAARPRVPARGLTGGAAPVLTRTSEPSVQTRGPMARRFNGAWSAPTHGRRGRPVLTRSGNLGCRMALDVDATRATCWGAPASAHGNMSRSGMRSISKV